MKRIETTGFGVALVGHAALFGALYWFATFPPPPIPIQPIEISFADDVGRETAAPQPIREAPAQSLAPELGEPREAEPAVPDPSRPVPRPLPRQVEPLPTREPARSQPR